MQEQQHNNTSRDGSSSTPSTQLVDSSRQEVMGRWAHTPQHDCGDLLSAAAAAGLGAVQPILHGQGGGQRD